MLHLLGMYSNLDSKMIIYFWYQRHARNCPFSHLDPLWLPWIHGEDTCWVHNTKSVYQVLNVLCQLGHENVSTAARDPCLEVESAITEQGRPAPLTEQRLTVHHWALRTTMTCGVDGGFLRHVWCVVLCWQIYMLTRISWECIWHWHI